MIVLFKYIRCEYIWGIQARCGLFDLLLGHARYCFGCCGDRTPPILGPYLCLGQLVKNHIYPTYTFPFDYIFDGRAGKMKRRCVSGKAEVKELCSSSFVPKVKGEGGLLTTTPPV